MRLFELSKWWSFLFRFCVQPWPAAGTAQGWPLTWVVAALNAWKLPWFRSGSGWRVHAIQRRRSRAPAPSADGGGRGHSPGTAFPLFDWLFIRVGKVGNQSARDDVNRRSLESLVYESRRELGA